MMSGSFSGSPREWKNGLSSTSIMTSLGAKPGVGGKRGVINSGSLPEK